MKQCLWYQSPAQSWDQALPLGNGRMGLMDWGGVEEEILELTESTFFSGCRQEKNCRLGAKTAFARARQALLQGDFPCLEDRLAIEGEKGEYGTNLPVGRLVLRTRGLGEVCGYHRELDLENAVARTSFCCPEGNGEREVFVSHADRVAAVHLCFQGTLPEVLVSFVPDNLQAGAVQAEADGLSFVCCARERVHSSGSCGTKLAGRLLVQCDGTLSREGETLRIQGASQIVLKLVTATDYPACREMLEEQVKIQAQQAASQSWDELLSRHREEFSALYGGASLSLSGGEELEALPTDQRLARMKNGERDLQMEALLFQYGKYLFLSANREDAPIPSHLQGVWNDNIACRMDWTCDMHLDINTQMNYWPALVLGYGECQLPLFDWLQRELVPSGERTAKELYGCRGWVAHTVSNAWGFSAPGWGEGWDVFVTGGAWTAFHLWEHWLYTGDREFLENRLIPVYRGLTQFFLDYLVWDETSGCWQSGPSISPENSFVHKGEKQALSLSPTVDVVIIRKILSCYLEAVELLKLPEPEVEKIRHILEHLPPFQIDSQGRLMEWQEEYEEFDSHHRHTSHLLAVYPFQEITAESSPDLQQAVWRSLWARWKPEELWEDTGWARALLLLYSASLHRPEDCHAHIRHTMAHSLTGNMMVMHPPTAGATSPVYELDGNTGYTAGVAQMLVQRLGDTLWLLPGVGQDWPEGSFHGLCLPGGVRVSASWKGDRVRAVLSGEQAQQLQVRFRQWSRQAAVPGGQEELVLEFGGAPDSDRTA